MNQYTGNLLVIAQKCMFPICAMVLCYGANAGHIQFYEKRAQAGDLIGTIPDARGSRREKTAYNLKNTGGWDNDEVTSLRLLWVTPGTTINLYNSPSGSKKSDWAQLVVKDWDDEIDIRHLESTRRNNFYDQVYYNHDGDLNGKVSRIEVIPGRPVDPPLEARLTLCMQELHDFRKSQGRAHEFGDQGSNYRQYFPSFTAKADGSFDMRFKVNHIRGRTKDDYAIVKMGFDKDRVLQNTGGEVTIDNISKGDDSLNLSDVVNKLPKDLKKTKYGIIATAASAVMESIYETGVMKSESGGRKNFPNVIESVMNEYGKAIVDCGEDRYRGATPNPDNNTDDVNPPPPELGAQVQASQGKYAYKIVFQKNFDRSGEFAKVVKGKTLACKGNTCRWGSNDSTPGSKGCKKYRAAFGGMKVSSYGFRSKKLSEKGLEKCNK